MGQPHPNYRANDSRSIFATGTFNQELIDRLTPQIRSLRAQGNQPITVYVDSPGGSTRLGGVLASLLRCPGQDELAPRIITVVTGSAHSAAADLLAAGDYAIAYPEAQVHYHGTRQYLEEGITLEAAQTIADDLQAANEFFAIRLAERSVERFMFLFLCQRASFPKARTELNLSDAPDVDVFGAILRRELSFHLRRLPQQALEDYKGATELSRFIWERLDVKGRDWGDIEADVFRFILDYELARNKGRHWTLTRGGLAKAVGDFVMFNDFNFGPHRQFLKKFVAKRWRLYVTDQEKQELEARFEKEGHEKLLEHMEMRMEPLWHFVYSLCKRLQQSENPLSATDAYWLGIVDEVLGTQLPNVRELVENAPEAKSAEIPSM